MSDEIVWGPENARILIDGCKGEWQGFIKSLGAILSHQLWLHVGYSSFTEMWVAEGFSQLQMPKEMRPMIIEAMREDKPESTNQELADFMGVAESTIRNDLSKDAPKSTSNRKVAKPLTNVSEPAHKPTAFSYPCAWVQEKVEQAKASKRSV